MPIASTRSGTDERAALFPPEILPLFDDGFVRSCDLVEEYTLRLAAACFRATGLEDACAEAASVDEAVARAGLAPEIARVPARWILAMLARRGWVECTAGVDEIVRYRSSTPLPALDPQEMLEAQEAHDPTCLPAYRIAALAADHYAGVLRGAETGEQVLFAPEGISAWVKYFSNANPLYAVSNAIGAIAAEQAFPAGGAILEIGGGLGSGAEALLQRLQAAGRAAQVSGFRFTEISPLFLKRAERTLNAHRARYPLIFAPLDIDQPFAAQGAEPATYALVYGVNVLHVAHDLAGTLAEIRAALKDGGALVIAECVRPFAGMPLHLELVFNLLSAFRAPVLDPRWRPNGGFLTPEQWTGALEANGFGAVRIYPDIAAIRDAYPSFVVAAIHARRT